MRSSTCFLCTPDPQLVVAHDGSAFAMVGYGPITSTYCLLTSTRHVPSLADLAIVDPTSIAALSSLRSALERSRGTLLMTEHGRVPVCRDDGDVHDQHCFHGHALLFETNSSIESQAKTYYRERASFNNLTSALVHAATTDHYLLVSPSDAHFLILSGPLNAPRQLARTLVAIVSGTPHLADWRASPRVSEAQARASALRAELRAAL